MASWLIDTLVSSGAKLHHFSLPTFSRLSSLLQAMSRRKCRRGKNPSPTSYIHGFPGSSIQHFHLHFIGLTQPHHHVLLQGKLESADLILDSKLDSHLLCQYTNTGNHIRRQSALFVIANKDTGTMLENFQFQCPIELFSKSKDFLITKMHIHYIVHIDFFLTIQM